METEELATGNGKSDGNWVEIKPGCLWWYVASNGQLVAKVYQDLYAQSTAYILEIILGAHVVFADGSDLTNRSFIRSDDAMAFLSALVAEKD